MSLCACCSQIDFDRCFYKKPAPEIIKLNEVGRVKNFIQNRDTCPLCSLISEAYEHLQPEVFLPKNHNLYCGWHDPGNLEDDSKLLQINVTSFWDSADLFFNLVDESKTPSPMRARLVPDDGRKEALPSLLQEWLRVCKQKHTKCRRAWSTKTPTDLRLRFIDVKKWCLVAAPPETSYAALSYVWGTTPTVLTTKNNLLEHSTEGRLKEIGLPATISSAIYLVEKIGIPYIWVDALCIVQDDPDDKAHQIQNMDSVYSQADITIVQATGNDSSAPLLGSDGQSPTARKQLQREIKPGMRIALQWRGFNERQRAASPWTTRAWTFQEALLSSRMLIWHHGFVTWECREAVWCEDTVPGSGSSHIKPQFGARLPSLPNDQQPSASSEDEQGDMQPGQSRDSLTLYENIVQEYTSRQMTSSLDKLNAFAGIEAIFRRQFGSSFYWGLPGNYLDTAMLWASVEPLERLPQFPSWSWAGWKGKVWYNNQNPLWMASIPVFYRICSEQGSFERLIRQKQAWEGENYVAPARPWRIVTSDSLGYVKREERPMFADLDIIPHQVYNSGKTERCLCFQTHYVAAKHFFFKEHKVMEKESGKVVGGIIFDHPNFASLDSASLSWVILSLCSASRERTGNKEEDEIDGYFPNLLMMQRPGLILPPEPVRQPLTACRVLLVETGNDGSSERRGMGEINLEALNKIGLEWDWIVLS